MSDLAKMLLKKAFEKSSIDGSKNIPIMYGRDKITKKVNWVSKVSDNGNLAIINYADSFHLPVKFRKELESLGCLYWGNMYFDHVKFLDNFDKKFKPLLPEKTSLVVIKKKAGFQYLVSMPVAESSNRSVTTGNIIMVLSKKGIEKI